VSDCKIAGMRGEGGKMGEPRTRLTIRRGDEIDYSLAKNGHADVIRRDVVRRVASEALHADNAFSGLPMQV